MTEKVTKDDRNLLAETGTGEDDSPLKDKPIFSARNMKSRWEKLKATGKVPPLANVLKIIKRTKIES